MRDSVKLPAHLPRRNGFTGATAFIMLLSQDEKDLH
jgi:hypothetical protein